MNTSMRFGDLELDFAIVLEHYRGMHAIAICLALVFQMLAE